MNRKLLFDAFIYGFLLWLFGYILGIIFFMIMPVSLIGWVIMPLGIMATFWVLTKKIKSDIPTYYIKIGVIWALMAIILDYFLLVQIFKPADGYYKLDVYLYYIFTFSIPIIYGYFRKNK